MLETVRAYAMLELTTGGERDDALEGLARYCTGEALSAAEGLIGPAQVDWLNRVRDDLESYRIALAWLIESDRHTEAAEIAWGLMFFWLIRGQAAEGLRWYELTLARPSLPPHAESQALVGAAIMLYAQGAHVRARARAIRAVALAEKTNDMEMVAQAEQLLGHIEFALGHTDAARDRFARCATDFRAVPIPWLRGFVLTGLAQVALGTGNAGGAERLLDEATPLLRHTGPWFLSLPRYLRALLEVRRGHVDEAISWLRESLTDVRELHDYFAFFYTLVPLAAAASLKGEDAWAARILGARDAVSQRTGITLVDPSVHDLSERAEREVRARLGPDRWAIAYAAGRKMTIDALLKDIDRLPIERSRNDGPP